MGSLPSSSRIPLYCERIDPEELESAWLLLRSITPRLDRIAKQHGWPTPFAPPRYLILVALEHASVFGLTPRRLSRALALSPSTVAHHLDAMERAGLVHRAPRGIYDRRKVSVLLTAAGRYALLCFNGDRTDEGDALSP
jgi:DNA-binding MarR family transcriptional regulator